MMCATNAKSDDQLQRIAGRAQLAIDALIEDSLANKSPDIGIITSVVTNTMSDRTSDWAFHEASITTSSSVMFGCRPNSFTA